MPKELGGVGESNVARKPISLVAIAVVALAVLAVVGSGFALSISLRKSKERASATVRAEVARKEEKELAEEARRQAQEEAAARAASRKAATVAEQERKSYLAQDIARLREVVQRECAEEVRRGRATALADQMRTDQERVSTELRNSGLEVNSQGIVTGTSSGRRDPVADARRESEDTQRAVERAKARYEAENARIDRCDSARRNLASKEAELR